ncbi:MAG TPA: malto-oligosyltrehalose trehalohydrolase [Stellaceae bacterium]|nr:malto-oligosyltrehalose trehalohydrolase [Stellaceae bacterium]
MKRHHKVPFGAETERDGVRFRLWAPRASAVALRLEGDDPTDLPMQKQPDGGFVLTTEAAQPGTRYRYVVDGSAYPDPASRRQPDGVHGPSEVVDPCAYEWRDQNWPGRRWEEVVLYELHLGTFSETGDFAGAMRHLDHLQRLGITAIELMPIAEFPGIRNWGYDGTFLYAPCSRYGRPTDLKALIEACHVRGLAVLLDVVYNHFGPEGNYLPAIAPDFFTERHHTLWGAAIDFSGPQSRTVRDFFIENALYWLEEYHFDGLRFDAVHAIFDDSTPDIIDEIGDTVRRRIADREIHLVLENDRNEARRLTRYDGRPVRFTAQWNDDLHHLLHRMITGEDAGHYQDYAADPAGKLGRALAEGFAYQGEPSPFRNGRPRGEFSAGLPPTAFIAFLQNHDQIGNNPFGTRLATCAAEPVLHASLAIIMLSPQIPLLFMGEEWASHRPFAFFCDFGAELADAVREGRRREFAHSPGFRDAAARARIPDPTAETTFAMSRLDWDEPARAGHAPWLARYQALIELRRREIVPRLAGTPGLAGAYRVAGPRALTVEWHLGDNSRLMLAANFSERPMPMPDLADGWRLLYSSAAAGMPLSASFFLLDARDRVT